MPAALWANLASVLSRLLNFYCSGWVEIIASDGHDLEKRPFSLAAAQARVRELCGTTVVQRLFSENPRRAIDGESIEEAAIPMRRPRSRPGLLKRLFGKNKRKRISGG